MKSEIMSIKNAICELYRGVKNSIICLKLTFEEIQHKIFWVF